MKSTLVGVLALTFVAGCGKQNVNDLSAALEDDDLVKVGGKFDTGYYSSLAMELEADFSGRLELDVTDKSAEERDNLVVAYQNDPAAVARLADMQLKLAKNQLNAQMLHVNLSKGKVNHEAPKLVERDGKWLITVPYSVQVETLITAKELDEGGVTAAEMENTTYQIIVAGDPQDLYARAAETCAQGHESGQLSEYNYFYYFKPSKPGCAIPMVSDATLKVRSLLTRDEKFPEYDRLIEDQKIELAVFFGAAENTPYDGDWGVMMWRGFSTDLRVTGWTETVNELGAVYERERNGIRQIINLYSPYDLYDIGVAAANVLFEKAIKENEIIVYNGHSFYGSLDVLSKKEVYPENKYQIVFMNSCWSYEYYTKQVFTNKATEDDPQGWADVDVVNNTTYAYFTNMAQATRKLLTNLLAGAVSGGQDNYGRRFSWQSIIGIMNDEVRGVCPEDADPMDCRHYTPINRHEVYGVSGIATNVFQP